MNYNEALSYIHSLNRFGIHPGLERIQALCRAVGNPQDRLRFVHVAGTNGKGSTSTMIAGALTASGKRTGLFTSPYVSEFMERIQIDGAPAPEELFAQCVTELEVVVSALAEKDMQPTEFEVITAAAFMIFEKLGCDICVLEVGLGGRLDSTNIIGTPLLSVITSISLDHTAILGETHEEIAKEKCGIIKPCGTTVCYPYQQAEVFDVVSTACHENTNELIIPDIKGLMFIENRIDGVSFTYKAKEYTLSMSGEYQAYNAVTAIEACRALGVDEPSIRAGIQSAKVPARMEIISVSPLVLLDGGHNDDGGRAVCRSLESMLSGKKILAVAGMMSDKNIDSYLSFVAPLCSRFIATTVKDNPRAISAAELEEKAKKYCADTTVCESAELAVQKAAQQINDFDCLLICGSLYLAGEVRNLLKNIF